MLPVTGIQLPLISAGGTSTAATLFMIGIMANAARHEPEAVAALRAGRDDKMNRLLRLPLPEPYCADAPRGVPRSQASPPEPARRAAERPPRRGRSQGFRQRRCAAAAGSPANGRPAGSPAGGTARSRARASWIWPAPHQVRRPASVSHDALVHWKVSVTGEQHGQQADRRAGGNPSPAGAALSSFKPPKPLSVVLAGGGTAGHVEPAMAVADALSALDPQVRITALGTARGLETRLVPERGYDLELITPVPLPRKPSGDLARLPSRVWRAVRETRAVLEGGRRRRGDRFRRLRGAAGLSRRPRYSRPLRAGPGSRW